MDLGFGFVVVVSSGSFVFVKGDFCSHGLGRFLLDLAERPPQSAPHPAGTNPGHRAVPGEAWRFRGPRQTAEGRGGGNFWSRDNLRRQNHSLVMALEDDGNGIFGDLWAE